MPQVTAAITLNNGAATPVAISFAPERVSSTEAVFVDRSAGYSNGYRRITFTYSPPNGKRSTTRVGVSCSFPEISVVNGASVVIHTARYQNGEFIIPDTMSAASRADLRAFVANAMDQALAIAMVKDLDTAW